MRSISDFAIVWDSHMRRTRPLLGKGFVITGRLDDSLTRADAETLLTKWGALVAHKVTPATTALISTNPERRTTKRLDAHRMGVTVLDEAAFVRTYLLPHARPVVSAPAVVLPLIDGDRVRLVRMDDDPDPIPVGSTGTVSFVNFDTQQAWVEWDNGRSLALVLGKDEVEIL